MCRSNAVMQTQVVSLSITGNDGEKEESLAAQMERLETCPNVSEDNDNELAALVASSGEPPMTQRGRNGVPLLSLSH